jgi:hypothetical protein
MQCVFTISLGIVNRPEYYKRCQVFYPPVFTKHRFCKLKVDFIVSFGPCGAMAARDPPKVKVESSSLSSGDSYFLSIRCFLYSFSIRSLGLESATQT